MSVIIPYLVDITKKPEDVCGCQKEPVFTYTGRLGFETIKID